MKLVLASALFASIAYAAAPVSKSLALTIHGKTVTLTTAQLRALPQVETKVHDEHDHTDDTYGGVRLDELLARYGLPADKTTHAERLHDFVVATGTDRYWALYSLIEVESTEHDGDVVVALTKNGSPLGNDGELKLVSSGDKRAHRWVRNLSAITVKDATPTPAP